MAAKDFKASRRTLKPGLYGPLPTFWDQDEELDLVSFRKHLLNLAGKGIGTGFHIRSLGEAVHMTRDERVQLIQFTRKALDDAALSCMPIVAGVGGSSTRETIRLANDAADAGADAGMVILPAYYAASLAADERQIVQYYVDICKGSPIPLLLYNFPANAAGLDMSGTVIEEIVRQAPNLCGVKLTCPGNKEKLAKLTVMVDEEPTINTCRGYPLLFLDGLISDFTPWMQMGGHGTVSGIPNFAPCAGVRLWDLLTKAAPSEEEVAEAAKIQEIMAKADAFAVPVGVRGMKYVLNKLHGYSPFPRRPLLPLDDAEGGLFMDRLKDLLQLERDLEQARGICM
ncbi:putative dihydrodipicolinate synthase [Hortaea werneckii]|nr:putative dihydrodipicolinate synthase [Hortaea werneckii]